MRIGIVMTGRRAGKSSESNRVLMQWINRDEHVHSVGPDGSVCFNGECNPLRRATIEDVEALRK